MFTSHFERQSQFIDELQVSVHRLQHRVDQHGLFSVSICKQVRVRAAFRFKQLQEQQQRHGREETVSVSQLKLPIHISASVKH